MAKDKITEYDATANNNTVCGDVNIAENSALPSDMNNFAREIMSHLKEGLGSGTPLYVDQTNNRVGINKTPTVALDVSGDADLSGTLDVTGTVTAGGLTVDGDASLNGTAVNFILNETDTTDLNTRLRQSGALFSISTVNDSGSSPKAHIVVNNSTGDISFYEDTGTTPKLFWDASAESLGIGTSSPNSQITLKQSAQNFAGGLRFIRSDNTNNFAFAIDGNTKLNIAYNDSTKLVIDSSGNVGIGTSSPSVPSGTALEIYGSSASRLKLSNSTTGTGSTDGFQIYTSGSSAIIEQKENAEMRFYTNASERMRITDGGNVGIGTSSPRAPLHISPSGGASDDFNLLVSQFRPNIVLEDLSTSATDFQLFVEANDLQFRYGDASTDTKLANEAMRIDSSGNLLVGGTTTNHQTGSSQEQLSYIAGGYFAVSRSDNDVAFFNRQSSDGSIINIRKDGTTVGSIGSASSLYLYITNGDTGLKFVSADDSIRPANGGSDRDNAIDLGISGARFDDIYATNGTIQTSDQNEKNTITDSDLGIDFIKRLTPKSYIFNGKTRTHYGLIAQDVETVLTDINKPTSGFAGFIKDDISEEQDGSEYRYGLRYTEFVAPLIQAVKDQQATIDALTARITALENGE